MPPWECHAVTRPGSCRWGRAGWVVSYRRIILRAKMTQGSVQKSTHTMAPLQTVTCFTERAQCRTIKPTSVMGKHMS